MNPRRRQAFNWDQACAVLGVSPGAGEAEIRAAYLEKVRAHPPDRDPDQFEQVRDAYTQLRDPGLRARQVLESPDPFAPMADLLCDMPAAPRRFVGAERWLAALKEKRT